MRRPAASNFAVMPPILFAATASGLMIENVRSSAISGACLLGMPGERKLGQREGALLPGDPVRDARSAQPVDIGAVPVVVAHQGGLVRVLGLPAELLPRLVDRDERVLGDRL